MKEIDESFIIIENDILICQHKNSIYSSEVNLNKLAYAYATTIASQKAILFLFDAHQHRIPISVKGFKKVYAQLSERFNFNDTIFEETISSEGSLKRRIWKRKYEQNYSISDEAFPVEEGMKVYDKNQTIIPWDLPLESFVGATIMVALFIF